MKRCYKCESPVRYDWADRIRIREFKKKYPWVTQKDLAELLDISQSRVSEIIGGIIRKRGVE